MSALTPHEPKVSIIIPSYNQQEYLPDAIESALSQTHMCEVIVIDDGSTDSSAKIAAQYPVKLVKQNNKGLPSARNTGIMNSTGEYILPLDADDILQENCVEQLLKYTTSDADVIAPSFKTFGTSNELVILMSSPTAEDFKVANRIGYCSLIKKSTLLEVGGYSARMVHGWEDYALWFTMLARGKRIITVPDILWLYRTKEYSMIHEANKHSDELWAQIKKDHPQFWQ